MSSPLARVIQWTARPPPSPWEREVQCYSRTSPSSMRWLTLTGKGYLREWCMPRGLVSVCVCVCVCCTSSTCIINKMHTSSTVVYLINCYFQVCLVTLRWPTTSPSTARPKCLVTLARGHPLLCDSQLWVCCSTCLHVQCIFNVLVTGLIGPSLRGIFTFDDHFHTAVYVYAWGFPRVAGHVHTTLL